MLQHLPLFGKHMQEVELKATETLLDKGVKIYFKAPLFFRMFRKKTIALTLRNPSIGTTVRCSRYYLKVGLTPEQSKAIEFNELLSAQASKSYLFARLVACALLNSRFWGWLLTKPLAYYIVGNIEMKRLCKVVEILIIQGGIEDFTNIIGLAQRMNIMSQTSQQNSPTS